SRLSIEQRKWCACYTVVTGACICIYRIVEVERISIRPAYTHVIFQFNDLARASADERVDLIVGCMIRITCSACSSTVGKCLQQYDAVTLCDLKVVESKAFSV